MMAPFALQASNCSFVSPMTPRKWASFKDRASSGFALLRSTPYGQAPKYLICDNDGKFGSCFARVAATSALKILKTPSHAPRANAICERFLRSVRQECLDHLLILQEKQLQRVLNRYVAYFNRARPHQGVRQQLPEPSGGPLSPDHNCGKVISFAVLSGIHHDYRNVA